MQDCLRLVRRVDISLWKRLDELFVVVDRGIDNSITNGLRDNLLSLFDALQAELACDVGERNLRVRNVDLLQTKLNDGVLETVHKGEHFVSLEHLRVAGHKLVESLHLTLFHAEHDLIVREQVLLEVFLVENLAIGDLTH